MEFGFKFNFGGNIKMNFSIKFVQTIVSFISTKFVLCNGIIGWDVWLMVNHQIIHQSF